MNTKKLILTASIFAVAGAALADAPEQYVDTSRYVGTKTRAEVRAELNNAAPEQTLARGDQAVDTSKIASGGKTRAEVRAELEQAYRNGEYAVGNIPQVVDFSKVASTRTREEVRNEAIQGAKAKHTDIGG
jgi:hypothetical protein